MLKFKKSKILIAVALCAGVSLSIGAAVMNSSEESTAETSETAVFTMMNGTSLRYSDDGEGGLRFRVKMNESVKTTIEKESTSFGFIVAPTKYFSAVTDGDYSKLEKCISEEGDKSKIYESDGAYYANCAIVNILEKNRKLDYNVVAYYKVDDVTTYASVDTENGYSNLYALTDKLAKDKDEAQNILDDTAYSWYGTEDYPITVNTIGDYNSLVEVVNSGVDYSEKYANIAADLPADEKAAVTDESKLPVNLTPVDPFSDKELANITPYATGVTTTTEKLFNSAVYSAAIANGGTIGNDNYLDSTTTDLTYYFAVKGDMAFRFADSSSPTLDANVWYVVKMVRRTSYTYGGWYLYARNLSSVISSYTQVNTSDWRLGEHTSYNGKAYYNCFLVFNSVSGGNINLEFTDFYAETPTFENAFANLTKADSSVLSTANGATMTDVKVGDSDVYKRSDLTNADYGAQTLGSTYAMQASGTYSEYYFAIKVTVACRFGSSGTSANDLSKDLWYMIKLVKRPEGSRGWDVYAKRIMDDDSKYTKIAVDAWKVGDHDSFYGNTQPSYFMDVYCIDGSATFDVYGTAIYAKV